MKTFTGVGSMRANTLGASFKAVNAFDLVSITTNAPEDVVSDGVYDLASFATSSATVAVDSILMDGEAVDLSSVNVNAFTFT